MKKGTSAQRSSQATPTKQQIYLTPPHIDEEEYQMMEEVLRSNWIAPVGPHLELFEDMLSLYYEGRRVMLLNSGTAAIHLALKTVGVKEDDYVLCSDFTFSATANPIVYERAIPVFVDAETDNWGMDPVLLDQAIKSLDKKPAAIVVVHAYGMPARMQEIMEVAGRYDIPVIEDAAECVGSMIDGKPCGLHGDFGVLSFNGNKIVTTGGGGALIFKDKTKYDEVYAIASQGHTTGDYHYSVLGYNYRMSNVAAGLGIAQFRKLEEKVAKKRSIFDRYAETLGQMDRIRMQEGTENTYSNRWLSNIVINLPMGKIKRLVAQLQSDLIEARPIWKPLHLQSIYPKSLYKGAEIGLDLHEHGISLPSGTSLSEEDQQRVINEIQLFIKG
ncbi:MAG: DegT/DnrJ/EryC1/StrS family aminotransferase [Cyclobacteriaceae bacterium]